MQIKMLRFKSSVFILFLAIVLIFSCTGCKLPEKADDDQSTNTSATAESGKTLNEILADPNFTYPVKYPEGTEKITLTWFHREAPTGMTSFNETKLWEYLYKATNIDIKFIHPPKGQEKQQAHILISSGELPDIMKYQWLEYPGGINATIEQNIIIKLTDLVPVYAPNFYKAITTGIDWGIFTLPADEVIKNYFRNDDGDIVHIAYVHEDRRRQAYRGAFVRMDWLDKLGLDMPVTIADWEEMLTLFKNKMGASAPFTARTSNGVTYPTDGFLTGAFGFVLGYYLDDNGKVQYGYAHEKFFDFMSLYKRWYDNGLLDKDIGSMDRTLARSKILNGESGASYGAASDVDAIRKSARENGNKELVIKSVLNPVLNESDPVEFGMAEWGLGDSYAITTACKYPELALRFIDYGYTKEGCYLYNFGVEGITYYIDEKTGEPRPMLTDSAYFIEEARNKFYTDKQIEEISKKEYTSKVFPGININYPENKRYYKEHPESFVATWYDIADRFLKHYLPPITPTLEESEELARLETEITTYAEEMLLKFLFGDVEMNEANKKAYYAKLEELGLSRVLKLKQAAVDRFYSRSK